MKPGIPWSVKGIEPEVREAAKSAARRAGLTVGEWLNSVILDQNEQIDSLGAAIAGHLERSSPPPPAAPAKKPTPAASQREEPARQDDSALRLQDIARQLAELAQKERESAPFEPPKPEPARREEEEAFSRLLERIDDNERQTVEALTAVNERLSALAQQLAGIPRAPRFERPEDVPGYAILESAIRNVVEHIGSSERRSRDALSDIQNRLSALAEQAARRAEHDEPRAAALVADLDKRLADLSSRLHRTERLVQSGIPEDVRRELGDLGLRVEDVKAASAATLRDSEARILARLKDIEVQQGQSATLSDVGQMRGEIGSLSRLIEEVGDAAASERDIQALRVALEQLSARVAQGPDLRPLADMDRRLTELGRKLDHVNDVEHRIAGLDERLQEVLNLQADHPAALGVMEQNLASVGERLGRTEQQLRHIETMERAIRQLFDSLEQSRDENNRAAEEAASRAAEEAAGRAVARAMSLSVPQSGPSPELKALEQGLQAVRESAAAADRRNQQTLGAVQETLAEIVAKIAQLESNPPAAVAEAAPEADALAEGATGLLETVRPMPAEAAPAPEAPQAEAAAAQPSLAAGDDFIAAARRAAQAAASRPSALRAEYGPLAQPAEKEGFSFLKRFRKAEAPSAAAAPGQNQRKRLLLFGIVLLTAVSAFAFNMLVKSAPGTAPAAIGQPATPGKSSLVPDGAAPASVPVPASAATALPVPEVGTEALRRAAADGNPSAQYVVASRYLNGVGVAQDLDKAVFWCQQAAAKGYAPAQYLLGTLYERGLGAPKDAAKALEWYGKAAALGNVSSMHNAAVLLSSEQAGKPDYDRAFALFTSAAKHGLRDSQFNLAVFHERGLGTRADPAEAYFWYRLAAQQGDSQAAERATALTKTLPPDTLSKLTKRLAGFVPAPGNDAANVVAVLDPAWQDAQGAVLASGAAVPLTSAAPAGAAANDIEEAQRLLARLGFSVGTPDGKMNTRTSSAIRLFQLQAGMKVTGEITPELLVAMRAKAG